MSRSQVFALSFSLACLLGVASVAGEGPSRGVSALFDPGRVIPIRIEMPEGDWDDLRIQTRAPGKGFATEPFGPPPESPFTWFEAQVTLDGTRLEKVGVRKKGFKGSLDTERPAMKLDLGRFVKGRRLAGLRRLVLNNAKEDPALIRQCLGYDLFRKAGLPASLCNFAHVWINGRDLGVYVHVEHVGPDFLRRNFGRKDGALFEGTGSDFRPRWVGTFEPKGSRALKQIHRLQEMTKLLQASDATLLRRLKTRIDLDAFFTFWAVEVLLDRSDGFTAHANNYYVYRETGSGRFAFIPWGLDNIMAGPGQSGGRKCEAVETCSILSVRLFLLRPMRERYLARMAEVVRELWEEEALEAEAVRMETLLWPHLLPGQRRAAIDGGSDLFRFICLRKKVIEQELFLGTEDFEPVLCGDPLWRTERKSLP